MKEMVGIERVMQGNERVNDSRYAETNRLRDSPRVAIFIDYPNLIMYVKTKNLYIDISDIIEMAKTFGDPVIARLYTTLQVDSQLNSSLLAMERLGFEVIIRPVSRHESGEKKDIDTYIATDAVTAALEGLANTIIIVSNDSDFIPVIREIRRKGKAAISFVFGSELSRAVVNASTKSMELKFSENVLEKDKVRGLVAC